MIGIEELEQAACLDLPHLYAIHRIHTNDLRLSKGMPQPPINCHISFNFIKFPYLFPHQSHLVVTKHDPDWKRRHRISFLDAQKTILYLVITKESRGPPYILNMAALTLVRAYQHSFDTHPNSTLALTGGCLNALGDTLAQMAQSTVCKGSH